MQLISIIILLINCYITIVNTSAQQIADTFPGSML